MNLRKLPTSSLLVVAAVAWSHSCPLANARGAGSSEGVRSRSSASKKAQHLLSGEASSPLLRRPPSSLSVGALRGGGGRVVPDRKSPAKQLKKVNPVQPAQVASSLPTSGVAFRLKVTFYFALWYALNIYYNSTYVYSYACSCRGGAEPQNNVQPRLGLTTRDPLVTNTAILFATSHQQKAPERGAAAVDRRLAATGRWCALRCHPLGTAPASCPERTGPSASGIGSPTSRPMALAGPGAQYGQPWGWTC